MVVSQLASHSASDRIADDARMQRLSLVGIVNEVKKSGGFGSVALQRKCTKKPTITCQSRHVLQERMVGDTVIMIHSETDCREDSLITCHLADGDDRYGVLDNGAETRLVAEDYTVGAAIDQQHQSDLVMVHDPAIGSAQRVNAT